MSLHYHIIVCCFFLIMYIVVDISFTEDSYRANEKSIANPTETSFMPVRVVKTSRIANPIVLDVIPLTVDMARANTPPALPENIPVNNPFSPPFAGKKRCLSCTCSH